MAGNITNIHERALLDHSLGVSQLSFDSSLQVALFKGDPGEAGSTAQEVTEDGYQRQPISFKAAQTDGQGKTTSSNDGDVTFGPFEEDVTGTISHVGIINSGGDVIWYGPVGTAKSVSEDDEVIIRDGAIEVELD